MTAQVARQRIEVLNQKNPSQTQKFSVQQKGTHGFEIFSTSLSAPPSGVTEPSASRRLCTADSSQGNTSYMLDSSFDLKKNPDDYNAGFGNMQKALVGIHGSKAVFQMSGGTPEEVHFYYKESQKQGSQLKIEFDEANKEILRSKYGIELDKPAPEPRQPSVKRPNA